MDYLTWKWLHVLSSTLLFGTGIGTAFAMFYANRSGDIRAIAIVARNVVRADWLFTLPAIIAGDLVPLDGADARTLTIWANYHMDAAGGAM